MLPLIRHLLVCGILIGPMAAPGSATMRLQNRVGGSPDFASDPAAANLAQTVGWHRENPSSHYDFASGVRKYLYANGNPVNNTDPSGHMTIPELGSVMTKLGYLGARTSFTVYNTYNRVTAAYDAVQDVALVADILADGDVDEEESEVLFDLLEDYVKARVISATLRVATGAGGKVLGAAAGAVGRMRITQAGIQKTR